VPLASTRPLFFASADAFEPVATSSLWTPAMAACFDPLKAPRLHLGKIPEVVDCCPTQ
jgi:hypothetical protein